MEKKDKSILHRLAVLMITLFATRKKRINPIQLNNWYKDIQTNKWVYISVESNPYEVSIY